MNLADLVEQANGSRVLPKTIIERILAKDQSLLDTSGPLAQAEIRVETHDDRATQMELDTLNLDNPFTLYLIFSAIQQVQFPELIPVVLDNLIRNYSSDYVDPEARLFTFSLLPMEMLQYIVEAVPARFSLAAVFDSLIMMDSTDQTYDACRRAEAILGTTDFNSWVSFAEEADFQGNPLVYLFCMQRARMVAPFARRPTYLREPGESLLADEGVKAPPGPPEEEGKEDEITHELLEYARRREENEEVFRVLGPSNFFIGASARDLRDGTADLRMLTDDRFTDMDQPSWFTGSCDQCWLRIRRPCHAVRKPLPGGGWKNQYCSWDCARLACSGEGMDLVSYEMTFHFEKECHRIGLYDHLFKTKRTRGEEEGGTMVTVADIEDEEDRVPVDMKLYL